jgi:outer membrane protein assembly factor BamB
MLVFPVRFLRLCFLEPLCNLFASSMKALYALLSATLLLMTGCAKVSPAWPAFRGPNSSGVAFTAVPPTKIGPSESPVWKTDVAWSPSSPCIAGDRIFLTSFSDGKLMTYCFDRQHGTQLWARVAPAEKLEEFHATEGSPAAASPVTDGTRVVSYFGSCGLVCYDMEGKELWRYPLPTVMTAGGFGSGSSPIIAGDLVIVNRDQVRNSSLLAVRLQDGQKAWETARPDSPTSYGTPIVIQSNGADEILLAGSLFMKAYDPKTGAERWMVRGLPSYTCTTPALGGGLIFFAGWSPGKADSPWPSWASVLEKQDKNGDGVITLDEFTDHSDAAWFKSQDLNGNGKLDREDWDTIGGLMKRGENVLLAVKPGGRGDVTATHVAWKFERGLPYVPSPLYYEGRVYLVKDGGMISCFDAKTGTPFYTQERLRAQGSYYASPIAADGRIYFFSMGGKATVVKAGGDKPEVLYEADFKERIAGTPALVDNYIYIRTQTKLYAFGR